METVEVVQHGEARERVLHAAHQLFVTHGFAEVSMQQIAAAAGITKATMYHHYPGKEALFLAVCHREVDQMRAGLEEIVVQERPFSEQLEALIRFLLISASSADTARLIADLRRHVNHQHRTAMHDLSNPASVIRPFLQRAIDGGDIQPVDLDVIVPMLFGMVFGQVRFALDGGHPDHLQKDLPAIIASVLINGIGRCGHQNGRCHSEET